MQAVDKKGMHTHIALMENPAEAKSPQASSNSSGASRESSQENGGESVV